MSKQSDNNNDSPIRRISKTEKASLADKQPHLRREWPGKKHKASEQDMPMPQPGDKNRIHSVLVALPVLMLVIGLAVYFRGESKQNNGEPVVAEMISRQGLFKSLSEVSGIGTAKHYIWYTDGERARGARVTARQKAQLAVLNEGDALTLELAPRVAGSTTMWAYRIHHEGKLLIDAAPPVKTE